MAFSLVLSSYSTTLTTGYTALLYYSVQNTKFGYDNSSGVTSNLQGTNQPLGGHSYKIRIFYPRSFGD